MTREPLLELTSHAKQERRDARSANSKTERLGDHVDVLVGFPFKSASYTTCPDDIRLVRGDNIIQGRLRWDSAVRWPTNRLEGVERYFLEQRDVVVAMDRPWIEAGLKYACIGESDLPALLVQRAARLRGKDSLDQDFLYYLIGSRAFTDHVLAVQTGTAVPHISSGQILDFRFRLPSLSDQRFVAGVLGALNHKIEQNRRTAQALERLASAIFRAWFVDFEPVKAKAGGATAFPSMPQPLFDSLPTDFEEFAIGPLPRGWETGKLGAHCRINQRTVHTGEVSGAIEYVDISSVNVGRLTSVQRLAFSDAPSRARRRVRHGDTIWSCVRPNHKSYLFIHSPPDNRIVSTGFAVLSPCNFGPSFLYETTTQPEFVDHLASNADGSTYPAVRPEHFASAEVVVPPQLLLDAFESITMPLRDSFAAAERESATLAALRDYLLPKLLSGDIRVN